MGDLHRLPNSQLKIASGQSAPPIDGGGGGPHDPDMEAVLKRMDGMESVLARLEPKITEIHAAMTATMPHLATKADLAAVRVELADKPGKTYLWTVLGVLVATILGAAAVGISLK